MEVPNILRANWKAYSQRMKPILKMLKEYQRKIKELEEERDTTNKKSKLKIHQEYSPNYGNGEAMASTEKESKQELTR